MSTHTVFIEILSFAGTQSYKDFFHKVGKKWIEMGGVPHWCKQWTFLEDVKVFDRIYDHYGGNIVKFTRVFEEIGDPTTKMFVNNVMKRILYPVGQV